MSSPTFTTIDFSLVTREGNGRHATHDFSKAVRPIQVGDWLSWRYGGAALVALEPSYYWVVSEEAGRLVLRTPWGSNRLLLTHEVAGEMCFASPSRRLLLPEYQEETKWFAAYHWALIISDDDESGNLYMALQRFGTARRSFTGCTIPDGLPNEPGHLHYFLLTALYQCAHPELYERRPADARPLNGAEVEAFTKEVLRKVAKMGIS